MGAAVIGRHEELETVGSFLSSVADGQGPAGLLAGALAMATTSWLVVRTAVFGRWLAWTGALAALVVIVACASLSGVFAIPALLAWAAATSVALWRSDARGD